MQLSDQLGIIELFYIGLHLMSSRKVSKVDQGACFVVGCPQAHGAYGTMRKCVQLGLKQ